MRFIVPLLTAGALLSGCQLFARDHDSGPHASRNYPVASFNKLAVAGNYDVQVRAGGSPSVHAEGGQSRLDKMNVAVEGDTLKIEQQKGIHWTWGSDDRVKLIVTVPSLTAASLAGSGDIDIDHVAGTAFKGSIAGSGNLRLTAVDTQSLDLGIAGSGDITASGRSADVTYKIAGSGNIDGSKVAAQTALVSIAGSGGIHAHAVNTATVKVAGSGDVVVTGGAKCAISKAGSGNIQCS